MGRDGAGGMGRFLILVAVLFLGTMFAPVEDRDEPGAGFTHKVGDVVDAQTPRGVIQLEANIGVLHPVQLAVGGQAPAVRGAIGHERGRLLRQAHSPQDAGHAYLLGRGVRDLVRVDVVRVTVAPVGSVRDH